MPKEKIILVWYKRDLRVSDHRPLTDALARGAGESIPVVAFYVFEPLVTGSPDFSSFHRQFIEESLSDLEITLQSLGVPLVIYERSLSDALKTIQSMYSIDSVYSHEETGNRITYERDIMMSRYLRAKEIVWYEYPTNGVVRRLRTRDDWSRIWEFRMREPILPPPLPQEHFTTRLTSDTWQSIGERNIYLQKGGEKEGQKTVATFLISRGRGYMGGMSRPIEGQEASSRISPYLAYGCISLRQVVQMTWHRMNDLRAKGETRFLRSLQAFHSRLHWQSHFIQKLECEPRFEHENAMQVYDSIRTDYNRDIMDAIEGARTGIPFIDGVVRQLRATGWVNFRARATLVSFVVNTCMQPWQGRWAHWLARHFTDYEPGIHYTQLQMQAGTMGMHTLRIYNPVKQLYDKDSDGRFVETWLPELSRLPKHLQAEPWEITDMESIEYDFVLGRDYPHPIVDVESANRRAREILYSLKLSIHPEEKRQMIEKHASRKGRKKGERAGKVGKEISKQTPEKKSSSKKTKMSQAPSQNNQNLTLF